MSQPSTLVQREGKEEQCAYHAPAVEAPCPGARQPAGSQAFASGLELQSPCVAESTRAHGRCACALALRTVRSPRFARRTSTSLSRFVATRTTHRKTRGHRTLNET